MRRESTEMENGVEMPESNKNGSSVVEVLKADHRKVEQLFEDFESASTKRERLKITKQVINELTIHTKVEEKLVYPILLEEKEEEDSAQEAYEEHHVVKGVLAELGKMDGSEDNFKAKMKVLSELIKHHVKEEETELLPALEQSGEDLEALGQEVLAAKQKLMARKTGSTGRSSSKGTAKARGFGRSTQARKKAS